MDKQALQQKLLSRHKELTEFILSLSESGFTYSVPEKWAAGQHLQHILLSVQATTHLIDDPDYIEEKSPENIPMTYDELVSRYHLELKNGAKAPPRFTPGKIPIQQREQISSKLLSTITELCTKINRYDEEQLNNLTFPHPLLKRISIREMMYFTIYHAIHHFELIKNSVLQK